MVTLHELVLRDYPMLMEEVLHLNKGFGWTGFKDALRFIEEHSTHYDYLAQEFKEFVYGN
jgi:hypothetical protein